MLMPTLPLPSSLQRISRGDAGGVMQFSSNADKGACKEQKRLIPRSKLQLVTIDAAQGNTT